MLSEQLLVQITPGMILVEDVTLGLLHSLGCGSKSIWRVTPFILNHCILNSVNPHRIFLMLSSIHPPSDLYALQQGQATEELLLAVSSLASLQCWGEQTGIWTRVPGNQQPDAAQPITWLHVAPSKSPINWSDCPVDWKRGTVSVCVVCVCAFPSMHSFSLPVDFSEHFILHQWVKDSLLRELDAL